MPIWGFSSVTVTPARGFAEASYTVPYNVAFCEAAKAVAAHSRRTEHRNVNLNILLISPPKGFTPNCKWCNHEKKDTIESAPATFDRTKIALAKCRWIILLFR